jgi:hypothetical protein
MNDWILFGAATAITYAISEALKRGKPPAKPPIKKQPSPIKRADTYIPKTPRPTTNRQFPTRVHVDTAPRKVTVAPSEPIKPRTRKHRGSGPFGFTQDEMKAARKNFEWGVGAGEPEWDGTNNGWVDGLSEDEALQSGQAENLETHI